MEAVLRQVAAHAAVVWVTHDDQQPARVGGKVFALPMGEFRASGSRTVFFTV